MIGTAHELVSGDMRAVFLPDRGMLGISLQHRGKELLRRLDNLDEAAAKGSTAGIPLLYPWANRLSGLQYAAAGREVTLEKSSPLLHFEEHGLPIHGVKWAMLAWDVISAAPDRLVASLDWTRPELLAVFPVRHTVETTATLHPDSLTIETTITAGDAVPVSFGYHPYFGIPNLPRSEWRLELPAMRKLVLDDRGIPTGEDEPFDRLDSSLRELDFDTGFKVLDERPQFSLSGGGCRITVEFVEDYPYAQIFAPKGKDFVAIEPMTAPTNALTSGRGLRIVQPGAELHAAFRIGVQEIE
jgi:galactose mutarotase-like enzyme